MKYSIYCIVSLLTFTYGCGGEKAVQAPAVSSPQPVAQAETSGQEQGQAEGQAEGQGHNPQPLLLAGPSSEIPREQPQTLGETPLREETRDRPQNSAESTNLSEAQRDIALRITIRNSIPFEMDPEPNFDLVQIFIYTSDSPEEARNRSRFVFPSYQRLDTLPTPVSQNGEQIFHFTASQTNRLFQAHHGYIQFSMMGRDQWVTRYCANSQFQLQDPVLTPFQSYRLDVTARHRFSYACVLTREE